MAQLDDMTKSGLLYKRSSQDPTKWKPLHAQLTNNELQYFDLHGNQRGGLNLTRIRGPDALTIRPPKNLASDPDWVFELEIETTKSVALAASSESDMNDWVTAFVLVLSSHVASKSFDKTSTAKSGILYKQSTNDLTKWSPINVQLTQAELQYFDLHGRQRGGVDLTGIVGPDALTVRPSRPLASEFQWLLELKVHSGKTITLAASSEREMNDWAFAFLVVLRANARRRRGHVDSLCLPLA
ncbi:hypothetical protein AeNC1_013155 [Aphanomyces euteiches]|nr:hypothetical protein AeNC1_013155 [Aphanomyces euteiches]